MSFQRRMQPDFYESPLLDLNQRIKDLPISEATEDDLLSIADDTPTHLGSVGRNHSDPLSLQASSSLPGRSFSDLAVHGVSRSFRTKPRRDIAFKSELSHTYSTLNPGEKPPIFRANKRATFDASIHYDDVDDYGFHERGNTNVDFDTKEQHDYVSRVAERLFKHISKVKTMNFVQVRRFVDEKMELINSHLGIYAIERDVYFKMLHNYFTLLSLKLEYKHKVDIRQAVAYQNHKPALDFFARATNI